MPASEARCEANRRNAQLSTGPRTSEGKARSRGNAVKHGLTGEGVVLPDEAAAEVERLRESFEAELRPSGEVGRTLVRRLALLAVRMERGATQETAALAENVRRAEAEFDSEWPEAEGEDDPDRERMRVEAAHRALFDPSKEATLARKYEAAAERGFFRSLKELREVEWVAKVEAAAPGAESARSALGSFLTDATRASVPVEEAEGTARVGVSGSPRSPEMDSIPLLKSVSVRPAFASTPVSGSFDVPFSIGRAR